MGLCGLDFCTQKPETALHFKDQDGIICVRYVAENSGMSAAFAAKC